MLHVWLGNVLPRNKTIIFLSNINLTVRLKAALFFLFNGFKLLLIGNFLEIIDLFTVAGQRT